MKRTRFVWMLLLMLLSPSVVFAQTTNDPQGNDWWVYEETGVYRAWDVYTGSSDVVVAVIDNGFDTFHPDLRNNVWKNTDEIPNNNKDDDNNGYIDDIWGWDFTAIDTNNDGVIEEGVDILGDNDPRPGVTKLSKQALEQGSIHHGTLVAGLIGAVANNNMATVGVNWNVQLMNIRILDETGHTKHAQLDDAIRYAVDNGADVINFSFIGDATSSVLEDAIEYAYEHDVVMVAAAGNNNLLLDLTPRYPICSDGDDYQRVLGVSAVDRRRQITLFSNFGEDCIDITAPGTEIVSTLRYAPQFGLTKKAGGLYEGTSFAAPLVSATAAMLKGLHPEWTVQEVFDGIISTAHHTPPVRDELYRSFFGAGLLQVDKAIEAALEGAVLVGPGTVKSITLQDALGEKQWELEKNITQTEEAFTARQAQESAPLISGDNTYRLIAEQTSETSYGVSVLQNDMLITSFDADVEEKGQFFFLHKGVGKIPEIIFTPHNKKSKIVYRTFGIFGNDVGRIVTAPRGTTHLTRVWNEKSGARIATLQQQFGQEPTITVENEQGETLQSLAVGKYVSTVGDMGVGDIDGDGKEEFVLAPDSSQAPWVVYLNDDGSLKRRFSAFALHTGGVLRLAIGDVDADRKDDVILAYAHPRKGIIDVRVRNEHAQALYTWNIPYDTAVNPLLQLSLDY